MPAVEVLLNTKLIAELIEQGDFGGVKEAMEKSLAEGSQTFEADLARLINEGTITRDEGLAFADSPTNLLWRLQNESAPVSRQPPKADESDPQLFTEIVLDVQPVTEQRRRDQFRSLGLMPSALRLAEALIARPSVTPDDAGCQALLKARLAPLGFDCETLVCGPSDFRVTNLWAHAPRPAAAGRRWPSPATPTSCPPARWRSGPATRSCPATAAAGSTAAAPPT